MAVSGEGTSQPVASAGVTHGAGRAWTMCPISGGPPEPRWVFGARPDIRYRRSVGRCGDWGGKAETLLKLSKGAVAGTAKTSCFGWTVPLVGVSVGAGRYVAGNPACCAPTGVSGI